MMKLRRFGNSTSGRIEDKLQTIPLRGGKIGQKRIAIVKIRVSKRGGYVLTLWYDLRCCKYVLRSRI